jgi:hypothetical protein
MSGYAFDEEFVGKDTRLRQAVHSFLYFFVDKTIMCDIHGIVLFLDFIVDHPEWEVHVPIAIKWGI